MKDNELPQIISQARSASGVAFQVRKDPRGVLKVPELESVIVTIHLGALAKISCRRGGKQFSGGAVHGDIDIIPAKTPSNWEIHDQNDCALLLSFPSSFLELVARDSGINTSAIEIVNRFQIRDSTLESLSWAIKREIEQGCPSGRLYLDGLGLSFASRLITQHSNQSSLRVPDHQLNGLRLKKVLSFIEEQLARDLKLENIAEVAGVGVSHLQTLFRNAVGISVYQYVLQRRVERAKTLLANRDLSIADVADAAGFADQSHMARIMKRMLGNTPTMMRRSLSKRD